MEQTEIRRATAADAEAIFVVLEGVAGEIPVRLDGEDRRSLMMAQIRGCCLSQASSVAVDRGDAIGFLLAEADRLDRFHHDNGALHLTYAGMAPTHRGRGVLPRLIRALMAQGVPLTAEVKAKNASDMVQRLTRLGFQVTAQDGAQTQLRWTPDPSVDPAATETPCA